MLHDPKSVILTVLLACGCEGDTAAPPTVNAPEEPEAAPEPEPPQPVYTSAICCATGRICTLDDGALPLGTTCECPNPEGDDLQGRTC